MAFRSETEKISFSTSDKDDIVSLTSDVRKVVTENNIDDGICLVFAPHSTGILALNEDETGIKEDYLKGLYENFPEDMNWKHDRIDDNAHSHLKSLVVGVDKTLPVTNGDIDLGRWQDLFFIETDGPRERRITVKTIGETE